MSLSIVLTLWAVLAYFTTAATVHLTSEDVS